MSNFKSREDMTKWGFSDQIRRARLLKNTLMYIHAQVK